MSTNTKQRLPLRTMKQSALTPTIKPGQRPRHDVVRVVVYVRVSEDNSGRLRSNAEQLAVIRAICESRGWKIVAIFDEGEFATGNEDDVVQRPEFLRMIEFMNAGKCDMLCTFISSRIGRGKAGQNMLVNALQQNSVQWCYNGSVVDLNDSNDEFTNGMQMLVDRKYSKELRQNVGKALLANAQSGAAHGRVPFGYDRKEIERGKPTNVPNADAKHVVKAVEMYLSGKSVRQIAAYLTAKRPLEVKTTTAKGRARKTGATTGAWDRAAVRAMLINPTYCGWRTYKGAVVTDEHGTPIKAWKEIITPAQHLDCVDLARHTAARTPNKGNERRHLLSGVALCGVCGRTLDARRVGVSKDGTGYETYTCSSKKGHVVINESKTNDIVKTGVIDRISSQYKKTSPFASAKHAHIDDMIALQRVNIEELNAALTAPGGSKLALAKAIEASEAEIERLEASRPTRNVRPSTLDVLLKSNDPLDEFERFTLEQQAALLRSLVQITIHPTTAANGVFDEQRIEVQWLDDEGNVIA